MLVLGGLTMPFATSLWALAGSMLFSILFYMLIFDDFTLWSRHRAQHWTLTTDTLDFEDDLDDSGIIHIPLTDITRMRRWFWWGLRIYLVNGRSVEMAFVPKLGAVRRLIQDTKREHA